MTLLVAARRRRRGRRPVRRAVLYGFIGSGNLGNDASFEVVLDWLRRTGSAGAEPQVITLAPDAVREHYGLPAVPLRLPDPLAGRSGRLVSVLRAPARVVVRLLDLPRTALLVRRADAVIVPGMGVLEEKLGVRPWGLPLWLAALAVACRVLDRRLVLLCVGAEPARNPVTRALFVLVVALADHVSYRDAYSATAMAASGARHPEAVAADLVLARPFGVRRSAVAGRVVVGVMRYHGDDDDPITGRERNRAYREAVVTAVTALLDAGDQVRLLWGDAVDAETAEQIREEVTRRRPALDAPALATCRVTTYAELCQQMARAEAAVATRYHNLVCALSLGVPVVSVGYADKNAVLMSALGVPEFSQPIAQLDPQLLLEQLHRARSGHWPQALVASRLSEHAARVDQVLAGVAEELGLGEAS